MSFRTLDLNLLRIFDAVMLEKSLTRAAAKLALTQPAVSNAVGRLRDALDDDLFVRAGYGVEPTARARELWPVIRRSLSDLEAIISPPDFDPGTDTTNFQLAMADATATTFLPQLVRYLEAEAPGMSLRVMPLMTRDPRTILDQAEIDIAVGYFPVATSAIKLHAMQDDMPDIYRWSHLYGGPYVCVMRNDHPLAEKDTLSTDDFCEAHHLLVSYSGRPFGFTDQVLASMGRSRRIVLTVNQFFTGGQVVANSDLLTVLPEHFLPVTGMADQLTVRKMPFPMDAASVDALWLSKNDSRPAHRWLIEAMKRATAESLATNPMGFAP